MEGNKMSRSFDEALREVKKWQPAKIALYPTLLAFMIASSATPWAFLGAVLTIFGLGYVERKSNDAWEKYFKEIEVKPHSISE